MAHSGLSGHHAYQHRSRGRRIQPGQLARLILPAERPGASTPPGCQNCLVCTSRGTPSDPAVTAPVRPPLNMPGNDAAECCQASGTDRWACQTTYEYAMTQLPLFGT